MKVGVLRQGDSQKNQLLRRLGALERVRGPRLPMNGRVRLTGINQARQCRHAIGLQLGCDDRRGFLGGRVWALAAGTPA